MTGALDAGSFDSKALWSTGEAGLPEGISGGESTGAPFEAKKTITLVSDLSRYQQYVCPGKSDPESQCKIQGA